GTRAVGAHRADVVRREEELAHRREMERRPAADGADDLHAGALGQRALDVDDLVALADGEVDRLAGGPVQLAHRPEGGVADIEPRLDEVAQLEQADAELVDAGVAAIDEARGDQVVEYAVGRGRMQSGTSGELLQADR